MSQSKKINQIRKDVAKVKKVQKALAKKNPPLRQLYLNQLSTANHYFTTNNYEIFELFDENLRKTEPVSLIEHKLRFKLETLENSMNAFRIIALYYRVTVTSTASVTVPSILDILEELQPTSPYRWSNRRNIDVFMDRTYCMSGSNTTNNDMNLNLPAMRMFNKTKRYRKDKLKVLKPLSENQRVWHPFLVVITDHSHPSHAPLLKIRNTTEYYSKI